MDVTSFNKLVNENKNSNRPWYFGLEGGWWYGLDENETRKKILLGSNGLKLNLGRGFVGAPGRGNGEGIWKEGDFICHYAGVPNRTPLKWLGYYGDPLWIGNRNEMG